MVSTFVPIDVIWSLTAFFAPCPIAVIVITAPTPIIIPSIVSTARTLLARSDSIAIRKLVVKICNMVKTPFAFLFRRHLGVGCRADWLNGLAMIRLLQAYRQQHYHLL